MTTQLVKKDSFDGNATSQASSIKKRLGCFGQNPYAVILTIGIASLLIRFYYFPYGVPLTLDASVYFFYSTDMSILKTFPLGYHFPNNGWPVFVSFFFSIFHFDKFLDYMALQRLIAISISVLTIIPLYVLCRRFFDKTYSLIGTMLFAFEPHIIQNSLLGLTEPLYIFLITASLATFLSEKRTMLYISFAIAALCSIVRYEGLVLFAILTIAFFIRFKIGKKSLIRYAIAVGIFVLIVTPMTYVRTQTIGSEGLVSQVVGGGSTALTLSSQEPNGIFQFLGNGLFNYFKYLGWVMLPFFVFLVPVGLIPIFTKRGIPNVTILLSLIILSIPSLYAYSREIQETRYLLVLMPLFSVVSIFSMKHFEQKIPRRKLFLILIIGTVLTSSVIFLELRKYDYEHQRESFILGEKITQIAKGVNDYQPEDNYLVSAQLPETWPTLRSSIQYHISVIPTDGFDSLKEYIKFGKEKGLTHLIVDGNEKRPDFLKKVFHNPEKYPYLEQVFDSQDMNFRYHVKILQIDYDKF